MNEPNEILTDALTAYRAYHDSLPDPDNPNSLDAASILADLDLEPSIRPIDDDLLDYARAFQISFNYDDCPLDIIALRTSPDTYTYFISIDESDYTPMIAN